MLTLDFKKQREKKTIESWGESRPMMKVCNSGKLQKIEFNPAAIQLFGWESSEGKQIGIGSIANTKTVLIAGTTGKVKFDLYESKDSENSYIYSKPLGETLRKEWDKEEELNLFLSVNTDYTKEGMVVVNLSDEPFEESVVETINEEVDNNSF